MTQLDLTIQYKEESDIVDLIYGKYVHASVSCNSHNVSTVTLLKSPATTQNVLVKLVSDLLTVIGTPTEVAKSEERGV